MAQVMTDFRNFQAAVCSIDDYHRQPVILGLKAGDTIGGPTAIAAVLAASVIDTGSYDRELTADCYLDWWKAEGFDTGAVFALVMGARVEGATTEEAVLHGHETLGGKSAGCSPAHRAPALAVTLDADISGLVETVKADAALTHYDPLAGDVAAAVAVLCRVLMEGVPWAEAKLVAADGRLPETVAAVLEAGGTLPDDGGYAPEVLAAAIYFLDRYPPDVALSASKTFAGGANYCPVLVGAVDGARGYMSTLTEP
jgi:ADP-ribosylglycohydrolase